ncbi:MAG: hypothetical protein AB7V43_05075 [Acidimicrobiia bacterium]
MDPTVDDQMDIDLEELTRLALAADADAPIPVDAIPFAEAIGEGADDTNNLLPSWYMPAPGGTVHHGRGWRRAVAIIAITAFLAINAAGLCSTYGWPAVG